MIKFTRIGILLITTVLAGCQTTSSYAPHPVQHIKYPPCGLYYYPQSSFIPATRPYPNNMNIQRPYGFYTNPGFFDWLGL